MTISELLAQLKQRDVKLRADGDSLKIDAPKGALGPELIALIREFKAPLLKLFSEDNLPTEQIPIRAGERHEFPLSLAQHAFFMLDQIEPGSGAYNIHSVRRLTGPIVLAALSRAL